MSVKSEYESLEERLYKNNHNSFMEHEYIRTRYEQSVKWYIKKANSYKKGYMVLSIISIVLPAIVPIITSISDLLNNFYEPVVASISVFASIATSMLTLFKTQEKWIHYRYMAESLQQELTFYISRIGKYDTNDEERNKIFAEVIEKSMGDENQRWIKLTNSNEKEDEKGE